MYKTCLGYVSISSSTPRPLWAAYVPILLSEVEQVQRPSGNGDRKAIVVEAIVCDDEGERAYTVYAHSKIFSLQERTFLAYREILATRTFRRNFVAETSAAILSTKRPESFEISSKFTLHTLESPSRTVLSKNFFQRAG